MTMQDHLLQLMRQEWISPLDALQKANCLSLSQRAGEMRRAGVNVQSRWKHLPNGKKCKEYKVVA